MIQVAGMACLTQMLWKCFGNADQMSTQYEFENHGVVPQKIEKWWWNAYKMVNKCGGSAFKMFIIQVWSKNWKKWQKSFQVCRRLWYHYKCFQNAFKMLRKCLKNAHKMQISIKCFTKN